MRMVNSTFTTYPPGLFNSLSRATVLSRKQSRAHCGPVKIASCPRSQCPWPWLSPRCVSPLTEEIAQEEFKELEQQRVLGIVPNFYVSYVGEAAPLTPKRKFGLALKATTDPVTIVAVASIAGMDQATNRFSGYGQGAQGYGKRYGASYANFASGLWIGGAVLPSILKQDPRYFYKGSGTNRSRFLYAVSRPFICKGDNQRRQPNYSSIFGDLAAGGLSNLYIPERDRHGARLTFENAGIPLGTSMVINVLQEFVLHRLTSRKQ